MALIKGGLICSDFYGNEPFNIDNNVTTLSGFAQLGYPVWATPAIGDLKKTEQLQLLFLLEIMALVI